jgi:hypothetical protein
MSTPVRMRELCLRFELLHDILTEYLTLFWFAMLVNKISKDANFGQCLYLGFLPPLL